MQAPCSLAGTIQESWGSMLSNLTVLELSNCSLRGTLPASFGRTFQSMTDLDLSGNRIAGSLPLGEPQSVALLT